MTLPRERQLGRPVAVLVLVTVLIGCGFFAVHGPTPGQRGPSTRCTTSAIGPVADLAASGLLIGGAVALADTEDDWFDLSSLWIIPAIGAAGFGSSGIVGMIKTDECRAAKAYRPERERGETEKDTTVEFEP